MNSSGAEQIGRDQRELNAYYDGELGGLRRWLFERRLARSPKLRAELEQLERVAHWVQQCDPQPQDVDVWHEIAPRLTAIDSETSRQRRSRGAAVARVELREPRGLNWLAVYARPISAVAVAAALAFALFLGIMEPAAPAIPGMIRWLDTGGRSVLVLEDQGDATIVWLLDAVEDGTPEGGSREAV